MGGCWHSLCHSLFVLWPCTLKGGWALDSCVMLRECSRKTRRAVGFFTTENAWPHSERLAWLSAHKARRSLVLGFFGQLVDCSFHLCLFVKTHILVMSDSRYLFKSFEQRSSGNVIFLHTQCPLRLLFSHSYLYCTCLSLM